MFDELEQEVNPIVKKTTKGNTGRKEFIFITYNSGRGPKIL